jgi:lipoyl(octanoyl) transferase
LEIMGFERPSSGNEKETALQAYLLGLVDFEAALALQRRWVYQVAGERSGGVVLLCEHPPLITVGRHGSHAHILAEADELRVRQWPVRWVNRGGGCWLHLPGQLAIYAVVALDRLGIGLNAYLAHFQETLVAVLDDFGIRGETHKGPAGVWSRSQPIACLGVAVRDWVAYFGAILNVNNPLHPCRLVRCGGAAEKSMTSLVCERRGPLRPALVRERFLEHFRDQFAFSRVSVLTEHPSLCRKRLPDAVAANS